jgi:hypothetical protein
MSGRGRLTVPRRFLVLAALMFWQGGFTFYASVVVPIGQQVLASPLDQGFITRRVTEYLNLSGAAALVILAIDLVACRCEAPWGRRLRWLCWLGMAATLGALFWLHPRLDQLLDVEARQIRTHMGAAFRSGHRWYLWLSTFQWGFALLFAWLTLRAWRREDRTPAALAVTPPDAAAIHPERC